MRKIQVVDRKQIERECKFYVARASRAGRNAWSTVKISALFSSVRHAQILQLFQAEIVKIIEVLNNDGIVELFPSLVSPPWHQVSSCLAEKKNYL